MSDKDIEKGLRDVGKNTGRNYPPELYTARRAEWTTMVHTMPKREKKGCPLSVLIGLGYIAAGSAIGYGVFEIVKQIF